MRWTAEEVAYAQANWSSLPRAEIAAHLGRNLEAVAHYAYRHGWSQYPPSATYEQLTETEKAYIAGIVDGEGHIEIGSKYAQRSRSCRYTVSVIVANTDFALLDWMARRLPGSYINRKAQKTAPPHYRPAWTLRIHRRGSVRSLLTELLPYMIVKRSRALEAVAAIDAITRRQWR